MYEYGVIIRRARAQAPVWQFLLSPGKAYEDRDFLAVMNYAGARGFEAFAAGNFDQAGVPEVLLKRALPVPAAAESAGEPGAAAKKIAPAGSSAKPAKPAARVAAKKEGKA